MKGVPKHGRYAKENNDEGCDFNIDAHFVKHIARVIAEVGEAVCPSKCTEEIIREKLYVFHFADTGDDRYKSSNDRYKTGKHDRNVSVFFIEFFGSD